MADPAIGTNAVVAVDYEASWGVDKGTPVGKQISVVSCGITGTQELLPNPSIRGNFNPSDPANGKQTAAGAVVFVPNVTVAAWWLKLLCGTISSSGVADPYTHTIKIGTATPPSAVVEVDYNIGGTHRYVKASGVRVNKLTIPISAAGFSPWTADCMAKSVAVGTSAYDATLTDWTSATPLDDLQLASADVEIPDATDVGYLHSGTIDISANLFGDDYRVGASGARGSLVPQLFSISGNLRFTVDSVGVLTLLNAGTATSLRVKWTAGTNRTVEMTLPRLFIQKVQPSLLNAGPVMVDCQVIGSYDTTTASAVKFVVVNDQDAAVQYV